MTNFRRIVLESDGSEYEISVEDFSNMGLKKPCLCIIKGNHITKVASFNDYESAVAFFSALKDILNLKNERGGIARARKMA